MNSPYKYLKVLLLFYIAVSSNYCFRPQPDKRIQLIIDADTANEVDDLFALVRAILEPNFNLRGITSAQFHTSPLASDTSVLESQQINQELIQLMNRSDIALPVGSNIPLSNINTPASSEAADFIIKTAHQMQTDQVLQVVILGSCTNIASAILKDSTILPKIKVHYIGFWHDVEKNIFDKKEFNSGNDTLAVEVLLNTKGLEFEVMTATTCQHLVFEKDDVDQHLKGKGGVADYLVKRWETYERWWTKEDPQKEKWIMWDLAIIEALIHPDLAKKELFNTPPENTPRPIYAYTSIEVDSMIKDFWQNMESLSSINK